MIGTSLCLGRNADETSGGHVTIARPCTTSTSGRPPEARLLRGSNRTRPRPPKRDAALRSKVMSCLEHAGSCSMSSFVRVALLLIVAEKCAWKLSALKHYDNGEDSMTNIVRELYIEMEKIGVRTGSTRKSLFTRSSARNTLRGK